MVSKKLKNISSVFILVFMCSFPSYAQDFHQMPADSMLAKNENSSTKNLRAFPFAAPAYTPELGPTLIAVMMVSFKTDQTDTIIQRSSTPVNIGASLRGSYFMNTIVSTFWFEDRLRVFGELRFRNMPDHYWGVGYNAAASNPGRDESTSYNRVFWKVSPQILWQFKQNYFAGINIDYNRTLAKDVNSFMEIDPNYLEAGAKQFNSGLGFIIRYDSRDVPVNAWSGILADIQYTRYTPAFGGSNNFHVFQTDVRAFQQIFHPGSTLALQLKGKITSKDTPYTDLAMLGSPYDLRGYFLGHYRDRSMVFGIAEYRHQFQKKDGSLSKSGMVGWIGTGSIGTTPKDFQNWLPNAGIGYRFEVQPRMNVRAEFGFGKNSRGFYFSFNEAF